MSSTIEDIARHWDHTATSGSKDLRARTVSHTRRFTDAIAMIEATPKALIRSGHSIGGWAPESILRLIALRRMFHCVCEPSPSD